MDRPGGETEGPAGESGGAGTEGREDSGQAEGIAAADEDGPAKRPRPKRKVGLGRRVGLWMTCYLLVALMYVGFFSYPVEPARLEGLNYVASEKVYQTLPYTYETDYISLTERSVVVVLTVRTIQVPDRAYSAALRNAEGITEDYLRDEYGLDVEVRYTGEGRTTVQGHEAVRQDYDVHDKITGPLGRTETVLVARMSVLAWFCNENFISVAAGFFHRAGVSPDITGSLRCH